MASEKQCISCAGTTISLLALGSFPLANRFSFEKPSDQVAYPFTLGRCTDCALVQNLTPPPLEAIVPELDWISYNEPEGHVPELVDLAMSIAGIGKNSRYLGLTLKESSTLSALQSRGCQSVSIVSPSRDLGHFDTRDRPESALAALNPESVASYVQESGESDVLISRQTIEHAPDFSSFIACISQLICSDGYVIFEVPDCERNFQLGDYSMLWDEHVSYFTESSFKRALKLQGLEVVAFKRIRLLLEDSLVAVARKKSASGSDSDLKVEASEVSLVDTFVRKCSGFRSKVRETLEAYANSGKKLYIFGASHPAISFLNVMQVDKLFECVVDDNPDKLGYHLAGSGLPIRSSSELNKSEEKICLLALNPAYDNKIVQRNQIFCEAGGEFLSIYPGSKFSIQKRVGYGEI